jgi:hypothetical protein
MSEERETYERLVESLNDDAALAAYKAPHDRYRPGLVPRILGALLIASGNLVYGRAPSYQKFRAIEVIARVPYHSWASMAFTLLTLHYADEARAMRLTTISRFAEFAADNETMHVVVISGLARAHEKAGFVRHTLIPVAFGFFYFWASYLLYALSSRAALELNYLFEHHAFVQYDEFLARYGRELARCSIDSPYLVAYGRNPRSQYEFFRSVRNDELVHRNRSAREIALHRRHAKPDAPATAVAPERVGTGAR